VAKGCHEISDVLGYQHCSRYGLWSRDADTPRMWIDLGFFHRNFAADPTELGYAARSTTATTPIDPNSTANGFDWRIVGALSRVVYVGGESQWGWINEGPALAADSGPGGPYFGFHALAGAHVEKYRFALAGELAAGVRLDELVYCLTPTCKGAGQLTAGQARRELEARGRLDFFFSPEVSLGFGYGRSVIERGDSMWMINMSVHGRAMDGM
jgi:hypothetical protein